MCAEITARADTERHRNTTGEKLYRKNKERLMQDALRQHGGGRKRRAAAFRQNSGHKKAAANRKPLPDKTAGR
jgi:hypothetical protein